MANNPNIILGAGQGRPESVDYNSARNIVQAGAALQSKQEQQDRQQAMQAQQMFQTALQQTGGDYDQAVGRLRSQGVNTIGIETELAKSRKATYDAIKSHYDATKSQHDTLSGLAGQITDEASWQQYAPEMMKVDPDLAPMISSHPHYDPNVVHGFMALGEAGNKILDRVQKGNEALLKGEYSTFMGNQLATTESQDDLDKVIHAGQSAAVPGFIMARVPKVWSPNVPAMGMSWAMTAKEKSDATDKAADNARQAARDAQTAANENANLKLRGQEVGIQAGNLAERRKEGVAAQLTPQNVNDSARTTLSGTKYLDMGDFETPKEKSAARAAAQAAKLPVVDAKTGASLRAIDSAKQNAMEMWRQIGQYLPKDASGRILGGPENTLAKVFQTHPELGAYGAWRTAAIQQVQALAEPGMGLRINQAEINAAMENDIPQITDDAATGAQRLKNLFTMLNNKERDALTRDRSTLNAPTSTPATGNPFRK